MCVVHRCAANSVTFVVAEARHDLYFCHCTVVCTNPSPRDVIPTGSAYDFLGGSQLCSMSESSISEQEEINFSVTLFNCNTRANHIFWQSNLPEYCWEESLYDRQIEAQWPAVGRVFPFCHCSWAGYVTKAPYTLSVKLSDFTVWRHTWRKNWVNSALLAGNIAGLRTVLSSCL